MRKRTPAAMVVDDPAARWQVPARVLARAAADAAPPAHELARQAQTRRAHTMMVSPAGDLLSVVMSGYLADPGVPHAFMDETLGCPRLEAQRASWAAQHPQLADLAVHSARDQGQPFNLFGSLLASELGFALVPLHGLVFFSRVPGQGGVVGKLPVALKDLLAAKLITLASITRQVRPDFVTEQDYQIAWARIRVLLVAAHEAKGIMGGGSPQG